eukprot:TRINITY_DN4572_c0_g1_i1.p1 TRINITY_DN4572_c0_g1~~TRINITY_DN4572_c0_g1_i1.p1  ORF type:complete len:230 (-),score=29.35 TRINITY_DN4572_c0_g1_i1:70-693(-)
MRPEEPQSLRDLALALKRSKRYLESLKLLAAIIEGEWDVRFSQIEVICMMDIVSIAQRIDPLLLDQVPEIVHTVLVNPITVDLRIVLTWDSDGVDMGLIVKEPSGEICNCFNNVTSSGGMLSREFTQGYGPVEYLAKKIVTGEYKVSLCFLSPRQSFSGGVTAKLCVYAYYGHINAEKETIITVRFPCNPKDHVERLNVNVASVVFN